MEVKGKSIKEERKGEGKGQRTWLKLKKATFDFCVCARRCTFCHRVIEYVLGVDSPSMSVCYSRPLYRGAVARTAAECLCGVGCGVVCLLYHEPLSMWFVWYVLLTSWTHL